MPFVPCPHRELAQIQKLVQIQKLAQIHMLAQIQKLVQFSTKITLHREDPAKHSLHRDLSKLYRPTQMDGACSAVFPLEWTMIFKRQDETTMDS